VLRLKQFIREIHRRSLWQVLGIYLVGSWVAYEIVATLTESLGLPSWFPAQAIVLIIIGLPIVLATAFVQEGVGRHRGAHPDESGDPSTTSGGTPIPPAPAVAPTTGVRLFTWRNAIAAGVIALAILGVVGTAWLLLANRTPGIEASAGGSGSERIGSIAVLAFEDMSAEGDQEYFSDGIAEEILDALARVDGLRVAARSSAFKFKGTNTDIREVGEQLGVETVLEGSVRKSGDRLRITAQLVSADNGFHLWSDSYDRQMADIFAVQEEIAGEIVSALGFELPGNATPAGPAPEATIAAHDFYLLGLHRWNNRSSTEDLEATLAYFEQAAREDSLFARAHAAMAMIHSVWPQHDVSFPQEEAIRLGKAEAARAAELDPTLAEPDAALCQIATWYEWEWARALEHCRRAIELTPNFTSAHQWFAELLIMLGREDEALVAARRARELDPLAPIHSNTIAWIHNQTGEYEAAIAQSAVTLAIDPDAWYGINHDIVARFGRGSPDGLREAFLNWAPTPEDSLRHTRFVELFLQADTDEVARQEALTMVTDLSLENDFEPSLYLLLGEPERAGVSLEGMYADHNFRLPELLQRKIFEPLYDDPRFIELKRKTGLDRPPAATD
jgi:TolB-like protein